LLFGSKMITLEDRKVGVVSDYHSFLSARARRRAPSAIRELQPLLQIPGMISLGGGNPNASLFPIEKIELSLRDGSRIEITGSKLEAGLQYSPSYGLTELVSWLKAFQEKQHQLKEHGIPDWEICVTTGSQDGLSKAFDLLLDQDDSIITENPTYSGSIASLRPIGCKLIGTDTDEYGIIPELLETRLSNWSLSEKPPKVLYVIPTGQNPSGSTMTLDRKKRLYNLASKFNLLILGESFLSSLLLDSKGYLLG